MPFEVVIEIPTINIFKKLVLVCILCDVSKCTNSDFGNAFWNLNAVQKRAFGKCVRSNLRDGQISD